MLLQLEPRVRAVITPWIGVNVCRSRVFSRPHTFGWQCFGRSVSTKSNVWGSLVGGGRMDLVSTARQSRHRDAGDCWFTLPRRRA
nr:hypothetical protein CFP56_67735 [Quercus suber]